MKRPKRILGAALCALSTWFCTESTAHAHTVVVDGAATEWLAREANADNLGLIARGASGEGSYVWRDVAADTRTDIAAPETIADITRVRVTSSAAGLSFFVTLNGAGAHTGTNPVQLQIAIDTDQVAGSGENNFGGFADTLTAENARWERLVQTQFTSGTTARVLNTSFTATDASVPVGVASTGSITNVELTVSWASLGLTAPPSTPLRFTVASFRERAGGDTVDIGGPSVPNALDVVSDYGNPRTSTTFNTFNEFNTAGDMRVDYNFDVYFNGTSGDPYAPLLITRFVPNLPGDNSLGPKWFAFRNMTPSTTLNLAEYRISDEEAVGGTEGTGQFPAGATLAPGSVYVVAYSATLYNTKYGEMPDAELTSTAATVPDLVGDTGWTSGGPATVQVANGGDELLVLDRSHTAVDIVAYGSGAYAGVTTMSAPASGAAASRNQTTFGDTDNCTTDFTTSTALCADDSTCGLCGVCTLNVCAVRAAGFTCRASTGTCDVAETCDGTATTCPADGFAASTVECRAAGGTCDVAETCTGTSAACPADGFVTMGTTCRVAVSACDMPEVCTGTTAACPTDQVAPMMTVCRAAGGACDVAETCDGLSNTCPADLKASNTTVCRASGGLCDVAESCDGMADACPADSVAPSTTVCRASGGLCDAAESCDGSTAACPADTFAPSTTVCRASGGDCDVAETCTGSSAACPMDTVAPSTTVCRASAGACDVAETCDGVATACPADTVAPNTTVCRASAGDCDVAESCDGASGVCPADTFAANTVTCRVSAGDCDTAETCTGSSAACPVDSFAASTVTCRASAGVCDSAESCTGSSAACPVDAFAPSTTVCRTSSGACDLAESCSGSSAACPADFVASNTTVCRPSAGACDSAETCDGVATVCPADGFVTPGTSCADSNRCNGEETCNATGVCQAGTPVTCAPSMNACQVNACNNTTGMCELSSAMAGTSCSDGVFCNGDETCNGMGMCLMGTPPADAGAVCTDAGTDASADAASDAGASTPDASDDGAIEASAPDAAATDAADDSAIVTDAIVTDAIVTDAIVTDAIVTDAIVIADASDDAAPLMDAADDAQSDARVDARADALADARADARADASTMTDASSDGPGSENDGVSGGGCGCRTAPTSGSTDGPSSVALLAAIAMIVGAAQRRRRAA